MQDCSFTTPSFGVVSRPATKGEDAIRQPARLGQARNEVTYFFLVSATDKFARQPETDKAKHRNEVTRLVRQEGGQCHLYALRGAPFEFISMIKGIDAAAAARVTAEINRGGFVMATLVSGMEMFGDPVAANETGIEPVRSSAVAAA